MGTSITDAILSYDMSVKFAGTAFRTETYVHARWAWIVLPTAAVIFSTALLVATAIGSRRLDAVLWKPCVLPLLTTRLHIHPEHGFDSLRAVDDVQRVSKEIRVSAAAIYINNSATRTGKVLH